MYCFDMPYKWEFMKVRMAIKTQKSLEIKDKERKNCQYIPDETMKAILEFLKEKNKYVDYYIYWLFSSFCGLRI